MLPLNDLEFNDLLQYMLSDKIKIYKIGDTARFIKIQGVITLYYRYNEILMTYTKTSDTTELKRCPEILLDFKEFINFYYNKSISKINSFSKQRDDFLRIKKTLSDNLNAPNNQTSNYFDTIINKHARIKDFIINKYSEYLI